MVNRNIKLILLIVIVPLFTPFTSIAQDGEQNGPLPSRKKITLDEIKSIKKVDLVSLSIRWDYLNRHDSTQDEDYTRLMLKGLTDNRLLNPCGGIEFRVDDMQVRSYWIGDDIRIKENFWVHLRLNHLEFADWETAINHANFYVSYKRWWLRASVGMGLRGPRI